MADSQASQSANRIGANYITANRFYVEMDKTLVASFSECQGMGVTIKKESYFEGGLNDQQRIILGQAEFSDVSLKHGMSEDTSFWDWMNCVLDPSQKIERRNVNILLFNQAGHRIWCWTLIGAVPIRWQSPPLQADSATVAIEELTLAYEGIKVEKPSLPSAASDQSDITLSYGREAKSQSFASH
jgi:phage tail-like protein